MDLTDSAMSGWIAGLLAAAVTIIVTAWWEARSARAARLDDAVSELASAAIMYRHAAMAEGRKPSFGVSSPLVTGSMRVRALAARGPKRRLLRMPRAARVGLAITIDELHKRWVVAASATGEFGTHVPTAAKMAHAIHDASLEWLANPRAFSRARDLSARFIEGVGS